MELEKTPEKGEICCSLLETAVVVVFVAEEAVFVDVFEVICPSDDIFIICSTSLICAL